MRVFDYELLANIQIDAELISLISEIKEFKGKHNFFNETKKIQLSKMIDQIKIQSIESSNRIEGIITTEQRITDLFYQKTTPQNRDEEEIVGYRDVFNLISDNFEHIKLTPNHILQIHRDLYKFSSKTNGGKYKVIQNYIQEIDAQGNKTIRFIPLEPFATPDAIDSICQEYDKALNLHQVEPLILIPIFILDFLSIHPFSDGNGRVSRLLTLLLLFQNEFMVGRYISLEKLIEEQKDMYYTTLNQSSQNWENNQNDLLPFVKYMMRILVIAYRQFDNRVVNMSKNNFSKSEQIKKLFDYHLNKLSKAEIKKLLPEISEAMIELTLGKLVKENVIKKIGSGKSICYVKV